MPQDHPPTPIDRSDEPATSRGDARIVQPGVGRALHVLDETATFKVGPDDTGGRFSLVEIDSPPGGGTPPHRHESADEVLYVLEGTYEVEVGGRREELAAGGCAFVPRGTEHAYVNRSLGRSRLLSLSSPATSEEVVFLELASMFAGGPQGSSELAAAMSAIAVSRGMEVRGSE